MGGAAGGSRSKEIAEQPYRVLQEFFVGEVERMTSELRKLQSDPRRGIWYLTAETAAPESYPTLMRWAYREGDAAKRSLKFIARPDILQVPTLAVFEVEAI
jgi:hypothetical protein